MARGTRALAALCALLVFAGTEARAADQKTYEADLAAFISEVDTNYPFLKLKGIQDDWDLMKGELPKRLKTCRSDAEFLKIVIDAIHCLRDAHMGFRETKVDLARPPPEYYPGISFMPAAHGRVIVMHPPKGFEKSIPTGTVVTHIDGRDARSFLDERAKKVWNSGGSFSSPQRARLFEYRIPFRGRRGEKHTIVCRIRKRKKKAVLKSTVEARGWAHTYNLPANLVQAGRSFRYAKLARGAGYMYIRRIDASVEPGIARALDAHPDAKGWIVDLRGNSGGGYDKALTDRVKTIPPPVAVIIDAGCISAGETFARDLARYAGARLFGSKTAGASSSKRGWTFPSGIATLTFSARSRWRIDGKPIEFNGIEPDVEVEADPVEVARGMNSQIRKAEEYLREQAKRLEED